ncbi:MAG: LysR family transcriptional regulator [Betaproteobacteria bacterium]|nr:LysR family transcriptional regulator [Betaproteobacteria bacterium]
MKRGAYEVIDLKALRCFFSMAKQASLTKAGIELGISEAAVSQRVKGLEHYLGAKLYETRGGKVRLTPAGERTTDLAFALFQEIEQHELAITSSDETGELVLSTHDTILRYLLPDRIEALYRAHPLARLRLLSRPVEETLRLVHADDCDLGVVPRWRIPRGLVFHAIATHPAFLLLPKGHRLATRARADFRSLLQEETARRHPLILLEVQREGSQFQEAMQRLNLSLNANLEVGTIDTLKHYVARGLGIAVISGLCVSEEDRGRFEVVPIPEELGATTTYGVVMRTDKRRSPLLTSLLKLLGPLERQAAS